MGLLSKLKPSRPRFSTQPATIYRATIRTEEGSHPFVYITDPYFDEPVVLTNKVEFEMPKDPTFVKTRKLRTEIQGKAIPVFEIAPVQGSEVTDEVEKVAIPDEFRGKTIPYVDLPEEEIEQLPIS